MEMKVVLISLLLGYAQAEICDRSECVYNFDIRWSRTMTYSHPSTQHTYNVMQDNHKLLVTSNSVGLDDINVRASVIGRHVHDNDVITADGRPRGVITINGQFPGPAIEVMENTKVSIYCIVICSSLHHCI